MPCTEEEDQRSNSANPHRFTTVGIGIVASSTQIDSANAVVATGQIGRMCQLAIVTPMVLGIRTTMKMVSGNLRFQCKIPIFVPGNHCAFSLVWRCDIFARPQPNQSTKIGLSWHTKAYRNNLRGYRSEKRKFLAFLLLLNELSSPPWGALVAYRGCFVYVCLSSVYVEQTKFTNLFETNNRKLRHRFRKTSPHFQ